MSNSLKMGPVQNCFKPYMKPYSLSRKFTTPRECRPGPPLHRLISQDRCNRSVAGTILLNRLNRNIKKRDFSESLSVLSKDKDVDNVAYDLLKFGSVVNTGNYWQVLVTLKKKEGEIGRDRWSGHMKIRGSRSAISVTNVVSDTKLGNFHYANRTSQCLENNCAQNQLKSESAPCQYNTRQTIESIANLLYSATKRIIERRDQNRNDLTVETPEFFKRIDDQETVKTMLADKMVSKLKKSGFCSDPNIERDNGALEDQLEREINIRAQIYHKSEQSAKCYKDLTEKVLMPNDGLSSPKLTEAKIPKSAKPTEANPDCTETVVSSKPAETNRDCAETVKFPKSIDAYRDSAAPQHDRTMGSKKKPPLPRIHIKVKGSINMKRNSLGKLEGTYRTKTSTRIQKKDG